MTIEQIVAQHPCPIIRGKIMENVMIDNARIYDLREVVALGIIAWGLDTKQGLDFWNAVCHNPTATYSDLKHLDKSYVPEPEKPLPVWRKINPDSLPIGIVATTNRSVLNPVFYVGIFHKDRDGSYLNIVGGGVVSELTHYIQLSDLLNLPTEA
jgi:hypothetical protein